MIHRLLSFVADSRFFHVAFEFTMQGPVSKYCESDYLGSWMRLSALITFHSNVFGMLIPTIVITALFESTKYLMPQRDHVTKDGFLRAKGFCRRIFDAFRDLTTIVCGFLVLVTISKLCDSGLEMNGQQPRGLERKFRR